MKRAPLRRVDRPQLHLELNLGFVGFFTSVMRTDHNISIKEYVTLGWWFLWFHGELALYDTYAQQRRRRADENGKHEQYCPIYLFDYVDCTCGKEAGHTPEENSSPLG